MITHETIEGRAATVAYINNEFEPVDRDEATMIKIMFDDGEIRFGVKSEQDQIKSKFMREKRRAQEILKRFDPNQPRDPHTGEWIGSGSGEESDAFDSMGGKARPMPPPGELSNPIDPNASNEEKLRQLVALTKENKPIVERLAATAGSMAKGSTLDETRQNIMNTPGPVSEVSVKKAETIIGKATRQDVLDDKPWFGVEHIRDSLRFRTSVDSFKETKAIVEALEATGEIEIVKYDSKKLTHPKEMGWRILPIDLKMKNGQMVEYYILPKELREVGDEGHKIFEKWRDLSKRKINALGGEQKAQYDRDTAYTKKLYNDAWARYFKRTGETEQDLMDAVLFRRGK